MDRKPVWTPDGRRITFASDRGRRGSPTNLFWQAADGSGSIQQLTTSPNEQQPGSWHPNGRFLAFEELRADTMRDVMILPIDGDEVSGWKAGTPWPFVKGPRMDWEPRFSPDGHWLAYASTESGRWEVYVRPFPGPGPAVQVSTGGGELPTWSSSRREIVYGLDGQLMVVPYAVNGTRFEVASARPWVNGHYQTRGRNRMFDVHPDGDHVLLALPAKPPDSVGKSSVHFIINFFSVLQRLAPARDSMLSRP